MRVHRDLGWLAEATGRPGKRRGEERAGGARKEKPPKAALRTLGFTHLGGGGGPGPAAGPERRRGGRGGPAAPTIPWPSPRSPCWNGRGNGGGGCQGWVGGGHGRPPAGTGAQKNRGGAGGCQGSGAAQVMAGGGPGGAVGGVGDTGPVLPRSLFLRQVVVGLPGRWRGRGAALAAAAGDVTFSKSLRGFSPPRPPPRPADKRAPI